MVKKAIIKKYVLQKYVWVHIIRVWIWSQQGFRSECILLIIVSVLTISLWKVYAWSTRELDYDTVIILPPDEKVQRIISSLLLLMLLVGVASIWVFFYRFRSRQLTLQLLYQQVFLIFIHFFGCLMINCLFAEMQVKGRKQTLSFYETTFAYSLCRFVSLWWSLAELIMCLGILRIDLPYIIRDIVFVLRFIKTRILPIQIWKGFLVRDLLEVLVFICLCILFAILLLGIVGYLLYLSQPMFKRWEDWAKEQRRKFDQSETDWFWDEDPNSGIKK